MARRAVSPVQEIEADDALVELIAGYFDDPLGFVETVFPWGEAGTSLHDETGPDEWQRDLLREVGERIRNGASDSEALRFAVGSGHGVGKSALVAWLILWFISTRQNPQIVVTANTAAQLTGKTWRELAKWHKLMVHQAWFTWTATKFFMKGAADTWFASAVPWSKERAEAFAGTHEKHVLLIFDEASAIVDEIWEVAEGALTTAGAMWFAFGNGTRNTGRFRECFRRFRHRWSGRQVDSREAKKANKKQIAQWIEDYGEDSDFVRIRVRGDFPRAASSQFIGEDAVEAAVGRFKAALRKKRDALGELAEQGAAVMLTVEDAEQQFAPLILSVDVARFGDDQTVVGLRRGNLFLVQDRWRGLDTMQVAARVAEIINAMDPDAVFIDENGVGAGVVDRLRQLGYEIEGVLGQAKPLDERKYFNRRVEMWDLMKLWLQRGGMIEEDDSFRDDLTAPEYGFDGKGRFQLESKDDMKARNLPSPDTADCLAMTFYMPVAPRQTPESVMAKLFAQASSGGSHMST